MSLTRYSRYCSSRLLLLFPLAIALGIASPAGAQNYRTTIIEEGDPGETRPEDLPSFQPEAPPNLTNPDELRPLNQSDNILSLSGGQRLMQEAGEAIGTQNYGLAAQKLQEARQIFNQLSNFYGQLAESFSGIDNRIAENHRVNALTTAEMRDQATYQLALVHRAQNRPELSVPLLTQIVRSQNPTTELGKKAYQQLFELGFVDSPYPRPRTSQSSSSSTSSSN